MAKGGHTHKTGRLRRFLAVFEGVRRNPNAAAIKCSENADAVSKQLFERLVNDEEGHFDQFDKQLDNIKRFGPSYLALQSFGSVSEASASD
jgi:bacterioferritin (cytochrome b1)